MATFEDIREALDLIKEASTPLTKKEYDWGWIESNITGKPIKIGVNKQTQSLLLSCSNFDPTKVKRGKIGKLFGIDVLISEELK